MEGEWNILSSVSENFKLRYLLTISMELARTWLETPGVRLGLERQIGES